MEKKETQKQNEKVNEACIAVKSLWEKSKRPFIAALCAGLLIHFPLYSYGLLNPDAIWMSEEYIGGWEVTIGRWALWIFDYLHGGVNSPVLTAFLTLCFFSLGGALLNELFNVEDPVAKILVPLCITASPLVSITITYYYCSDAYAFAFFLSTAAILWVARRKDAISCIGGGACIAVALGVYQSNLGVAAGLAVLTLLFVVIETPKKNRAHAKLLLRLIVTGALGVGTYVLVLKISLFIQGFSMMSYKGADAINIGNILRNIPKSTAHAYQDFFDFFTQSGIMVNSYLVRMCYGAIFAVFFCLLIWKLAKIRRNKLTLLSAVVLVCLLPLCCNLVDVAAPQTRIILLTSGGMHCLCPAAISFCSKQVSLTRGAVQKKEKALWLGWLVALCAGFLLVWNYIIIANADAVTMKNVTEQQVALANRICARVEENEDYLRGAQVLVAGTPKQGNYPVVSKLATKTNQYANWGLVWGSYDGSLNCWLEIFRQKLGIEYNRCYEDQYRDIVGSEEFKKMPIFPAQEAVKTINGIVVIKISEVAA